MLDRLSLDQLWLALVTCCVVNADFLATLNIHWRPILNECDGPCLMTHMHTHHCPRTRSGTWINLHSDLSASGFGFWFCDCWHFLKFSWCVWLLAAMSSENDRAASDCASSPSDSESPVQGEVLHASAATACSGCRQLSTD